MSITFATFRTVLAFKHSTFGAISALLADRSAVRAVLIALHTYGGAVFTGITALAKDRTVGAIFMTILT